ncbi:MAG: response regulator [Actinomycetota bacterium]|nr:response regulator [Euzebyaceae bacterium]MDQ3451352.1 response regulator [Actinomycetota bacterium]
MSHDAAGTGGPIVLVVEDDRGVRDLMVDILSVEGFQVRTAGDGLEGLLKLRVLQPAALVLDIMMPDIGGLRVLDELASEHADVPVIVVTGKPEAAEEARRRLGPSNVFDKPFDLGAFVTRLREVANGPGTTDLEPPPGEQL